MTTEDALKIAQKFAVKNGLNIVRPCANRDGYNYFHLNFTDHPRYTGHPHVIKISTAGEVIVVSDVDEMYWAIRQITTTDKSL